MLELIVNLAEKRGKRIEKYAFIVITRTVPSPEINCVYRIAKHAILNVQNSTSSCDFAWLSA